MTEFFVNDCEEEGFRVVMPNGVTHSLMSRMDSSPRGSE
ncbi:hypothetical protein Ctha_1127 [Chloroherpeton thalassium ATCC 35110]|uniref:Uncharacterized protein n=1 Tax=Chloroherpeton thalassium (strain ATCC 35110 / GB-78) TaxID=517418 RepID=B3QYG3_CHLT3|nr:hypothetical protein Ctha_1127 [Chloroherpeton thalassium ATCC 35110]